MRKKLLLTLLSLSMTFSAWAGDKHRTDEIETWQLQPLVRQNDSQWLKQNYIQVMAGDKISFSLEDKGDNTIYRVKYADKNGKTLRAYKANAEYVLTEAAKPEDSGLYFVSEGQAVAAKTPDGFALIVGYDFYNVLLYDPQKQETYYGGMNDSTALFENSGNEFITYIKKFEK